MASLRSLGGLLKLDVTKSKQSELYTVNPINEELWLTLGNITEVRKTGLALFKRKRHLSQEKLSGTYDKFCAFCHQAKNYYNSALKLPWDSSPLLYYYSFMNLAKAMILLNKDLPNRATHGLSFSTENVSLVLRSHNINLNNDYDKGVFPILYEIVFNKRPNVNIFNIFKLFRYISQIYSQAGKAGIKHMHNLIGYARLVINETKDSVWVVMTGPLDVDFTQKWPFSSNFNKFFEVVDKDRQVLEILSKVFEMSIAELNKFTIYQSINTKPIDTSISQFCNDIFSAMEGVVTEKSYPCPGDFVYNLPYQQGKNRRWVSMNESLAIYLIMFYLCSLVRYRPDILVKLENKKERWLLESFVYSAPSIFLRHCVNMLLDEQIILRRVE